MKNLNLRGAIALVAVIALIVVAGSARKLQADSSLHADVSGFCSNNDDFGRSHGECVSIAQAAVNATAGLGNADGVEICKILEQIFGPFPLGQCLRRYTRF
jgi:hypothetical protein